VLLLFQKFMRSFLKMSVLTSKAKAVLHFAVTLKPLTVLSAFAWLVLIGSGLLFVSAQHPKTAVADGKKPATGTKVPTGTEVSVAQVQGAETTAPQPAVTGIPAIVSAPTVVGAPKPKPMATQSAPTNSIVAIAPPPPPSPILQADTPTTPVVELPVITPVQPLPAPFTVTAPDTISIAPGSSATLTYSVVGDASATWQGFYKNTIYSDGTNESPDALYHMVVPFSGSYYASSVTFTVTVEATAIPGSNNEIALYVTSDQGQGMTVTTKLTIL
jgi:hypothetical protein